MTYEQIISLMEKAQSGKLTDDERGMLLKEEHDVLRKVSMLLKEFTALMNDSDRVAEIKKRLAT